MDEEGWFDEEGNYHEGSKRTPDEYEEAWGFSYDDEQLYPNEGD